ncbi:MAG: hypothetical protein WB630_04405 [Candidatus Acidiferrales bacterium]
MKSGSFKRLPMHAAQGSGGRKSIRVNSLIMLTGVLLLLTATSVMAQGISNVPYLPRQVETVTTVAPNGDLNPYGVAFVPRLFPKGGAANPGDILVSNFNNSSNLQGTGTTIIDVPAQVGAPSPTLFFQSATPAGLTTALNILRAGYVLVGNFPSPDGSCGNATTGSIIVINKSGQQVGNITGPSINGPWDSAIFDEGNKAKYFVANALTGTVVRLDLTVSATGVTVAHSTQIASGYMHQCDPVTFVDAPTGLVYDPIKNVLYVASSDDNAIFAVPDAGDSRSDHGTGRIIYQDNVHLHGPLGMVMAPNGHLLAAQNDAINPNPDEPSEIVEFTITGEFVRQLSVNPNFGGAFGLAVMTSEDVSKLAAVDDNVPDLLVWSQLRP